MYNYLNKMRTEVVFIEEGHRTKSEQLEVKTEQLGQVMHLHSIQRQGGGGGGWGGRLLQKILPFSLDESISDSARRYVLIEGKMHSETWTFFNVSCSQL